MNNIETIVRPKAGSPEDYAADDSFISKFLSHFAPYPGCSELYEADRQLANKIVLALVGQLGQEGLRQMCKKDAPGLLKCLIQCIKDGNIPDGKECYLQIYGNKITYIPMISSILRSFRLSRPNCALEHICWSTNMYKKWKMTSGSLDQYPGAGDKPQAGSIEECLELIDELPGDLGYNLLFVQIIYTRMVNIDNNCQYYRYSFCYSKRDLLERAGAEKHVRGKGPWSGDQRKTDPNEMYIKTALRNFIKHDMGAADHYAQ